MIYFKIYFTLIIAAFTVASVAWSLMNSDGERADLWFKVSSVSFITTGVLIVLGTLSAVWFFPY